MGTKHTTEFRQEAVRIALSSGLTRKQVSADFGVGFSTLSRWIQQGRRELPEPTAQSDLEAEFTRLRKEIFGHIQISTITKATSNSSGSHQEMARPLAVQRHTSAKGLILHIFRKRPAKLVLHQYRGRQTVNSAQLRGRTFDPH